MNALTDLMTAIGLLKPSAKSSGAAIETDPVSADFAALLESVPATDPVLAVKLGLPIPGQTATSAIALTQPTQVVSSEIGAETSVAEVSKPADVAMIDAGLPARDIMPAKGLPNITEAATKVPKLRKGMATIVGADPIAEPKTAEPTVEVTSEPSIKPRRGKDGNGGNSNAKAEAPEPAAGNAQNTILVTSVILETPPAGQTPPKAVADALSLLNVADSDGRRAIKSRKTDVAPAGTPEIKAAELKPDAFKGRGREITPEQAAALQMQIVNFTACKPVFIQAEAVVPAAIVLKDGKPAPLPETKPAITATATPDKPEHAATPVAPSNDTPPQLRANAEVAPSPTPVSRKPPSKGQGKAEIKPTNTTRERTVSTSPEAERAAGKTELPAAASPLSDAPKLHTVAAVAPAEPLRAPAMLAPQPIIQASDTAAQLADRIIDMGVSGQWIEDVAREIAHVAASDGNARFFRLVPPNLGAMQVEVRQNEHSAQVHLTVETEAAEAAFKSEASRLVADAHLAAVNIDSVIVDRVPQSQESARAVAAPAQAQSSDPNSRQNDPSSSNPSQQHASSGSGQPLGQGGSSQGQGGQSFRKSSMIETAPNGSDRGEARDERADGRSGRARYA